MLPHEHYIYLTTKARKIYAARLYLAVKNYGDVSGTHTSGIYNPAFPEHEKNKLRRLCRAINRFSDMIFLSRPRGMHLRTIQKQFRAIML